MKLILISLCFTLGPLTTIAAPKSCPPLKSFSAREAVSTGCYAYSFRSPSLKRSVDVNVYVPRGYTPKGPRLPYAIFLHGRGGDRNQSFEIGAVSALDQVVRGGGRGFLIFAPSGGDQYWMNGAITKHRWGDLVAKDLVADIESRFHVVRGKSDARALMGLSMGGAGTLQLGFAHPTLFATAVSMSPIFRRENEIWKPGTDRNEPKEDYGSFGSGADYEARSPRHLCEKNRRPDGGCLPFKNFRLDMGENDDLLEKYSDSRTLILELKESHPQFQIAIGRCESPAAKTCASPADCYGHTFAYWSCLLPSELRFLADSFDRALAREPAKAKPETKSNKL